MKFSRTLIIGFFTFSILGQGLSHPSGQHDWSQVKNVVTGHVLQILALPEEDVLLEFSDIKKKIDPKIIFDEVKVLPSENRIRKGMQFIKCGLFYKSNFVKAVSIRVKIRIFQSVVVGSAKLGRHIILEPRHLSLVRRETTKVRKEIHTSFDALLGLRTTRLIQAGEILTKDLVESLPLISRGSVVEILFEKGALNIVMSGTAREDGRLGEKIRVKCLESRKVFRGEVINAKSVIVKL